MSRAHLWFECPSFESGHRGSAAKKFVVAVAKKCVVAEHRSQCEQKLRVSATHQHLRVVSETCRVSRTLNRCSSFETNRCHHRAIFCRAKNLPCNMKRVLLYERHVKKSRPSVRRLFDEPFQSYRPRQAQMIRRTAVAERACAGGGKSFHSMEFLPEVDVKKYVYIFLPQGTLFSPRGRND